MADQEAGIKRAKAKEMNTQNGGKNQTFSQIIQGFKGGPGNPTPGGAIMDGTKKPRGKK